MATARTPGYKLLMAILIGAVLSVPLFAVYALVWDREQQSQYAGRLNVQGWGNEQVFTGPVLVVPYIAESVETVTEGGKPISRTVRTERQMFLAPVSSRIDTDLKPEVLHRSIYTSVVYDAVNSGTARFALPRDFARYGIAPADMRLGSAELRFGVSDPRGLQPDGTVVVNGVGLPLKPGKGLNSTHDSGFFTFVDWTGTPELTVKFRYAMRGNKTLSLVPRAGQTVWNVRSDWPNPSFYGDFSPKARKVSAKGFTSRHEISNLALGQDLILTSDPAPAPQYGPNEYVQMGEKRVEAGVSQSTSVSLIEPVDLYSQVDRALKYGFLFIGFTFLAFLMFDIVAGARVAGAEYLLVGAGLILFFILLLAFAEVIGFMPAYLVASAAITGLLTAYSAAVLKSWRRARLIAGLLIGLYAVLYVLLNLEAYSLLIGSLLLFAALALIMWTTRRIDWSHIGAGQEAADKA